MATAGIAPTGMGAATWERNGEKYRVRAWSQFMRAGFGTPDWIVVAMQPERLQLAQATQFSRLYIPVVILALLLVPVFYVFVVSLFTPGERPRKLRRRKAAQKAPSGEPSSESA